MTVPRLQRYAWSFVLLLVLGVACRDALNPAATPTPAVAVRAGELYTCANGVDGCRVTYLIGPVSAVSGRVRIEFAVTLDGPTGGTTQWTNDTTFHEFLKSQGQPGIVLMPVSDPNVIYELAEVGGIAAADELLVAPVTHQGYWEFVVPEPPGTPLLLTYPDFRQSPVQIVVPE